MVNINDSLLVNYLLNKENGFYLYKADIEMCILS